MSVEKHSQFRTDHEPSPEPTRSIVVEALAFSVETAARAVSVSETTIKQEIAAGRLAIRKIGRRTVIRRVDLERWLDARPTSMRES